MLSDVDLSDEPVRVHVPPAVLDLDAMGSTSCATLGEYCQWGGRFERRCRRCGARPSASVLTPLLFLAKSR